MATQKQGRAAARAAAAILVVGAGFLFYWSLGGTWAFGGQTPSEYEYAGWDQIETAVIGVWCLVFAGVLLVRVGYWREHMPPAIARLADLNAWLVVILGLVSAVQAFARADPFYGTFFLILAALAFVVVRSERPVSPTSRAAPTPSGKPGPPTPTHFIDRPLHPYRLPPRRR